MPETTIHMTCSRGNAILKLRVTRGGEVKSEIVEGQDPTTTRQTNRDQERRTETRPSGSVPAGGEAGT